MRSASGTWITILPPAPLSQLPPFSGELRLSKSRSPEPKKERKYHYSFNVEDKGVDVSGFIVHTAKKNQGRHKFRVHLDSNDNGRFDKNDSFFGHTGLKTKYSKKGVGQILDEGEVGELKIKFKTLESNASMKSGGSDLDPIIKVMKFKHGSLDTTASMRTSDSSSVAEVTPNDCTAHWMCDSYEDLFGLTNCSTCYYEFIDRNGCSASQAQTATNNLEKMGCCTN
nr:hypothetical protein 47 [bacterium]